MKLDRRILIPVLPLLVCCGSGADSGSPDIARCASSAGAFSTTIDNPYFPLVVGDVHVLEGLEGGTDAIRLEFTVLDETQDVVGVTTRVLQERVWEDDADAGTQRHYVAQASDGTVCFYGTEGTGTEEPWMAGEGDALPAILMPGSPEVGATFEVVHNPPDDVEPVEISSMGDPVETPAGTFTDTVTLLADEGGPTKKIYARDIGLVDDDGVQLLSD